MSIYKDLLFLHGYLSDLSVAEDIVPPQSATTVPPRAAPRSEPEPAARASGRKHTITHRDTAAAGCA